MLALLLAIAAPQTAIEAERAFAADAKALGQWTAFRKWAATDAVMFWPQPVNAQEQLRTMKDPPKSVEWWPTASYLACDGRTAVNTGGWKRPDGSVGYFTTVWQRQPDGNWKWLLDHGDRLVQPRDRSDRPTVTRASCRRPITHLSNLEIPPEGAPEPKWGHIASADGTLQVDWDVYPEGQRRVRVNQARRRKPGSFPRVTYMTQVIEDRAPKP